MLLSVIIPAYKFERYILQCVNSVLSQKTNFFFEVLIRDDHSGDSTNHILSENFSDHPAVKILKSDKNVGAYENIRILLNESRGKYIAYLDGDDYYDDPDKLQKQIDFLENNPDYVMHSTGYRYVDEENNLMPPCDVGGRWLFPMVSNVKTEDLLDKNIVGFGRVFRNSPNLLKPEYSDITYVDWVTNVELSFLGKIRCEEWPSGFYRISDSGAFSKVSEEGKERERIRVSEIIKKRYKEKMENRRKVISIVDCFVHDSIVQRNLHSCLERLKRREHDVFLISNTRVDTDTLNLSDYYFYDKRNQLFKGEYTNVPGVRFWVSKGQFTVYTVKSGVQRHGLSVLINLFNALHYCKRLGYTHFQRFETDDLFGEESMDWISKVPDYVETLGKRGLFYFNPFNNPRDVSFHYFYCEIDYFLKVIPDIQSEEDYQKFLIDISGGLDFRIVENFLCESILLEDLSQEIILKEGEDIKEDFKDTIWNTVTSSSNMKECYRGCVSEIYYEYRGEYSNENKTGVLLHSENYSDRKVDRIIILHLDNGDELAFNHKLEGRGCWSNIKVPENFSFIEVFEDEELLYTQSKDDVRNYIVFH